MRTWIAIAVGAAVMFTVIASRPEVVRYQRIRAM